MALNSRVSRLEDASPRGECGVDRPIEIGLIVCDDKPVPAKPARRCRWCGEVHVLRIRRIIVTPDMQPAASKDVIVDKDLLATVSTPLRWMHASDEELKAEMRRLRKHGLLDVYASDEEVKAEIRRLQKHPLLETPKSNGKSP